ncbi:MAG: Glyoxalase-like domain protein [Crocinitomicaceae bacterium]|jgi:predicted lactoylglutathione lyase|nr:Glyoxalase-like domain protein [Crocinitomicaceae bacterium]
MNTKMIWANFASADLHKTAEFYSALGFKANGNHTHEAASFCFGKNDFVINFFTPQRLGKKVNGELSLPANGNEIIFSLSAGSKDEVDRWFEKIKAIGGTVFCEPEDYDQGYTFGFADPDGHKFNVLYWPGM